MTALEPCVVCRRHVVAEATLCPFCGARRVPAPRGRTRAAMFALATAACGSPQAAHPIENKPPPVVTPESPREPRACAPVPLPTPAPVPTLGGIAGSILDATCQPVSGATVVVTSPSLTGEQVAITDETGRFVLDQLPAGSYVVTAYYEDIQKTTIGISVSLHEATRVQIQLDPIRPQPDIIINAKPPYGAPPARRRVV